MVLGGPFRSLALLDSFQRWDVVQLAATVTARTSHIQSLDTTEVSLILRFPPAPFRFCSFSLT